MYTVRVDRSAGLTRGPQVGGMDSSGCVKGSFSGIIDEKGAIHRAIMGVFPANSIRDRRASQGKTPPFHTSELKAGYSLFYRGLWAFLHSFIPGFMPE